MLRLWTTLVFLSFTIHSLSEARHVKDLPSAVIVGTVYCDTCFQQEFSKTSNFIADALVAVECGGTSSTPSFREEVKTDEHGEFRVHLPLSVSKHVRKIKECSVMLISSKEPYCAVSSTATSSSTLRLKSRKEGMHIFSAGFFTFKPLKQPELCNQKPSIHSTKNLNSEKPSITNPNDPTFLPPIQDPPTSFLPPMPDLPKLPPLPQLPPLPPLPGLPFFPPVPAASAKTKRASQLLSNQEVAQPKFFFPQQIPFPPNPFRPPSLFPPNPFQPPPSLLPPNPFQPPPSILPPIFPSPPPSLFPPLLPSPPSTPVINFPPIPGFTPSPPPPPPSIFPIPLPPFPFQPTPGFPGIPPAATSSSSGKPSP